MPRTGRPPKAVKITRACEVCGTKWLAYEWDVNKHRFCSRSCWAKSKISAKNARRAEPKFNECGWCKTSFRVGGAGNPAYGVKYCCKSCASHARMAVGVETHTPPREMSNEERAWLAGFFDGEGCIAWPRRQHLHAIRLDIANTNEEVLKHVQTITGTGRILIRSAPKKPNHNQARYWCCSGQNSRAVLRQIHPWLIVKKHAAEVALGIVEATEPPMSMRTKKTREALAVEVFGEIAADHSGALPDVLS